MIAVTGASGFIGAALTERLRADGELVVGIDVAGAPDRHADVSDPAAVVSALAGADAIMTLRLQKERQEAGLLPSLREYSRFFGITAERVKLAAPHCIVMHPGPMNEGVEIAPDVAASAQSVIEEQVTNGVAVRMALLYRLAGT